MKHLTIAAAIFLSATNCLAQETDKQLPETNKEVMVLKNEAGVIAQFELGGNSNSSFHLVGAQYNRWVTPHLGYRIIAAYGNYQQTGMINTFAPHPDTIITKQQVMKFNMPIVGFGLMAQRHFYKRIVLYAAMELKGGYGKGDADTLQRTTVRQGAPSGSEEFVTLDDNKSANMLLVNMTASVGAKLQFSRVAFGMELIPVQLGYQNIRYDGKGSGIGEFNLGNFSQRVFFNVRF